MAATSASMDSLERLARRDALAEIFVPSRATVPMRTRPASAQSRRTSVKQLARARSFCLRNRAIVVWSGELFPQMTRKAMSSSQRRSIFLLERSPTQ
jgi:hypothetical protein